MRSRCARGDSNPLNNRRRSRAFLCIGGFLALLGVLGRRPSDKRGKSLAGPPPAECAKRGPETGPEFELFARCLPQGDGAISRCEVALRYPEIEE
jgi:hypothetical protein